MIELRNIEKSFGAHLVLDNMNLTFEKGEICMLLGPSGCGKSTLIRLINHLLEPEKGKILVDGKDIKEFDPQVLRRNMGYAIQGVGLFPHMHVLDNIAVVPKLLKWPKQKINNRVDELLELVGLPENYGKKYPHQLSGGEAQRVGVARALAADPEILLMDEPFGALDPINRQRLQEEFLKIQKKLKKTVVFVTHDVGEAVRMADKIVILQGGKIVTQGDPFSIANAAENVAKVFLGNSYTLELLEKYPISRYKNTLIQVDEHLSDTSITQVLPETVTLHDVLSHMFMTKKPQVFVKIDKTYYRVDFDTIMQVFGGSGI